MERSLTALCLLLCLAASAAAQDAGANANAGSNSNANSNGTKPITLEVQPGQTARIIVGTQGGGGSGIDPWWKDFFDIISKALTPFGLLLTGVSVVVGTLVAREQIRKNREERERNAEERKERQAREIEQKEKDREQSERNRTQREEDVAQRRDELRWRKAQLAREMLKGLHEDPYATDLMTMLDWDDRDFFVKSSRSQRGEFEKIRWNDLWAALRITEVEFNDKEKFIRDCLDAFFGRMQTLQHYLAIGLIELEDVSHPYDYYLDTYPIRKNLMFDRFIGKYHPRAANFISRVKDFKAKTEEAASSQAQEAPPAAPDESAPPAEPAATEPAAAYFMFDCPPGRERFNVKVEDPSTIATAREILSDDYEWHLTGNIVEGRVYYNDRWDFHVEPASISFVESDSDFAHRMNEMVEGRTGRAKAVFPENNVWHTGGARLLAELPAWWFNRERDERPEERAALRAQGRVADAAASAAGRNQKGGSEG